jgi:hypothetical protein
LCVATTNNNIQIASNWSIEFDEIFEISVMEVCRHQ